MFRRRRRSVNLNTEVLNVINNTYKDKSRAIKDISELCAAHNSIIPSLETINAPAGRHSIVKLGGTIPIVYKGNTYHLPIHTRVLPDYPETPPITFLVPTSNMAVVPGHKHVDQQGRCYFPYLSIWNRGSSTLGGFFNVAITAFSETPPLYAKPATLPATLPVNNRPPARPQSVGGGYPGAQQYGYQQQQQQQQTFAVHPPSSNPVVRSQQPIQAEPQVAQPVPISDKFQQVVDDDDEGSDEDDDKYCVVCFESAKEALVTPCNHISLCMKDANYMKNHGQPCPICRGPIESVIRVFIA